MINKVLINVDNLEYLEDYRKSGISAFLFALEGYSVGYKDFSLEEIKKVDVSNKFLLLNRIIDCNDIDSLKGLLKGLDGIRGIVFEDIGIYNLVKELSLDVELILFQNHFGTNSESVNFWLDRVDSLFISNEITYKEIKEIVSKAKKDVCLHLFGYNQVMYSRRLLLSNWSKEFEIPYKDKNVITDVATGVKFRAFENEYGTVMYSDKIFDGRRLLNLDNVKYYYINPTLVSHEEVMKFLNNKDIKKDLYDEGFLDRETIYKLKERSK